MSDEFDTPTGGPPPGFDTPSGTAPVRGKTVPVRGKPSPDRAEVHRPTDNGYTHSHDGGEVSSFPVPDKTQRHKTPTATSPAKQSEALAETVMTSILDRLTAEAERKGGVLSINDLHALDLEFKKKTQALQKVFQASFDDYVEARKQSTWDSIREYPFGRLLVHQYSEILQGHSGETLKDGAISRRVIPGFFVAINMMLGPEFVEGAQQLCRGIIDQVKARKGDAYRWDDFYLDSQTQIVLLDALVAMLPYFENLDRRLAWMLDIINSHLEPADPEFMEGEDAQFWVLDEHGLNEMLSHMFHPLGVVVANPADHAALVKRHGEDTIDDIIAIYATLHGR